jgi:hypothetical protein
MAAMDRRDATRGMSAGRHNQPVDAVGGGIWSGWRGVITLVEWSVDVGKLTKIDRE